MHCCATFFLLAEVYRFRTALGKQSAKNVAAVSDRDCERVRIAAYMPLLSP